MGRTSPDRREAGRLPTVFINYRRFNELTVKDSYPLPRMEDCLDSLGDARYFSTLGCNNGYWQIPVTEEDLHKTAFTCHDGCYEFCRMPFELTNPPATFQQAVDLLLSKYRWKSCLVYIDDVIVFYNTIDEHLQLVEELPTVLRDSGCDTRASPSSCGSVTSLRSRWIACVTSYAPGYSRWCKEIEKQSRSSRNRRRKLSYAPSPAFVTYTDDSSQISRGLRHL